MATNQQVIDRAAFEITFIESGEAVGGTDVTDALDAFNDMIHEWKHASKDFNWFTQDTLGDDAPIPAWALSGVISNLAIRMTAVYTVKVPPECVAKAHTGIVTITNRMINDNLEGADMSHMAFGDGRSQRRNIETDGF